MTVTAALSAAAAIALAGCTSGSPGAASSPGTGGSAAGPAGGSTTSTPLRWSSCTLSGVQGVPMKCANLQVPLNYADPGGRKITLALSEVAATAPASQQQGDLLVNPGGPGASGRSLAAAVAQGLDPNVAADYNIIGFDPRGVGASVPALHCEPSFFSGVRPNYIPASAAAEQVLINRAKAYAAGCEQRFGWLLPYMTTADVARDLDSIRVALRQQKINYYAFSYGTYLGQVYATMFPSRVRRMVLDSTVEPAGRLVHRTTSTRTTPSRAGCRRSSAGSRSTTAPTTWARPPRRSSRRGTRPGTGWPRTRSTGRTAR